MSYYVENGRKGGIAKGKKYKDKVLSAIYLFYKEPFLTKKQIGEKIGMSQTFVSKHTKVLTKPFGKLPKDFWDRQEKILLKNFLDKNLPINSQEIKKSIHKI